MPRVRVSRTKRNANKNAILFIIFWLAVTVECVALFNRNYTVYGFSRIFLVPIILVRIFWLSNARKLSVYFYLFLLFSLLADSFTIFGNEKIATLGLSFFTISYLSIACYFLQLRDNHNKGHLIFLISAIVVASLCSLWLYSPEIHKQTFYSQIALHSLLLCFMVYSLLVSNPKIPAKPFGLFLLASLFIVLGNILYAVDALYLNWRYAVIESIIGLCNGFYLFLLTKGALGSIKKI